MARYLCGGGAADWAFVFDADGDASKPPANTEATFWDSLSSGTQYTAAPTPDDGTGLVDGAGTPISSVTLDSDGFLPGDSVQTPDGVTRMAIDAAGGAGPRRWIYPNNPVALSIAAQQLAQQAQDTANAALESSGGTTGVLSVNDKEPDTSGNVALAAADVQAIAAAAGNALALALADQWMRIDIADEDNATSPNRLEWWFQTTLVNWLNEYGEQRLRAARDTTTPLKLVAHSASQSNNLMQVEDANRNALGGFRADGRLFGPNIGTGKLSKGTTAPVGATAGDAWVDTSQSPPVFKLYDGSIWYIPSGAGGGTPPAAAPAFVDATLIESGGATATGTKPTGGATLIACLAWNATDAPTDEPTGWSLVKELTTTSARAGVWVADASVTSLSWTWATARNTSGVVLAYEQCSVNAVAVLDDTDGDAVHTAPDLNVGTVPATVLRLWFDKTAVSAAQAPSLPAGVIQRALEAPATGSVCTVLAADAEQDTAGATGTVDATYDETANNAGGFTLALLAPA